MESGHLTIFFGYSNLSHLNQTMTNKAKNKNNVISINSVATFPIDASYLVLCENIENHFLTVQSLCKQGIPVYASLLLNKNNSHYLNEADELVFVEDDYLDHILVCLSSSPSNTKIIQTASQMANAYQAKLTALYVQTPNEISLSTDDLNRLNQHKQLAIQLGAQIETVYGDDIPFQIAQFARLNHVTKIVLGQTRTHRFTKQTLAQQLLTHVSHIDIHIIPDEKAQQYHYSPSPLKNITQNIFKTTVIFVLATLCSILFYNLNFTDSNMIMVYILGVLLTSIMTDNRIYSLISSIASVVIFNFLFTEPRFSLLAYGTGYPVTFLVMFLTAYITGTFANRYKQQAAQSTKNAYRTQVLFDTNQLISKAKTKEEILEATCSQIKKLLERKIILLDQKATPPQDEYLYIPIQSNETIYAILGVDAMENPLDNSESSILFSILGECALALDNEKNIREKEAAAVLAKSEQLRADLLRMISHDLRTPLTSISGNASNLLNNANSFDLETTQQLYQDIYDDSVWLTNLVENLLFSTRFEEGRMQLKTSPELLNDLIQEALSRTKNRLAHHQLIYREDEELLLVNVDAKLVIQVIVNIIDNAIKYTPKNSQIIIVTSKKETMTMIQIKDNGPGISYEAKQKIFEKFYTGENKTSDNRRSIGLGLYLCKAIVEAHGGTIHVEDNQPQGTVFTFSLPIYINERIETK